MDLEGKGAFPFLPSPSAHDVIGCKKAGEGIYLQELEERRGIVQAVSGVELRRDDGDAGYPHPNSWRQTVS
ncbi:hypothetical protein MATL_G00067790 [Megalops atlanticus]|uniref:Uncharacterized protein n=1 Tax=Megalops atlanticus TaxID=7932 RepID=A0A9D3TGE6_MEGAT|nr:hypothetical protein MATL_G00067790 [Megalops atlanticus]